MTATVQRPAGTPGHFVFHNVSWGFYTHMLDEIGDRATRLTFDNGDLEVMSPLPRHEKRKKWIARLVELLTLELDIRTETLGSTTFRREDLLKGLEPDECYYVAHAADVHGKDELDLTTDPPPDLAIEVDVWGRSIKREPIYAALGVPELWRLTDRGFLVLHLGVDGSYKESANSLSFPFLPMDRFRTFLLRLESEDQNTVLREFRDWAKTLR
jgi:Uma2 family endonuclease